MVIQKDFESLAIGTGKEAYLSRLSPEDRVNLQRIGQQFKAVLEQEGRHGELVIVGGTIDKSLPRKDIDALIVLQPHPGDAQKGNSTELDFATRDFETFHQIVSDIVDEDPSLRITEITEPTIDEEFGSPSILKTDGSIAVASIENQATPIEFIRMRERGFYREIAAKDKRPYVILERI